MHRDDKITQEEEKEEKEIQAKFGEGKGNSHTTEDTEMNER